MPIRSYIRPRWVGAQIDLFNLEDVVCWVAAEVQWVVARYFVLLFNCDLVASP